MFDLKNVYEAYTIDQALDLLQEKPNLRIIAGGTDVLVKIRAGSMEDDELLSIQLVEEMKKVTLDENRAIHIGAGMTFSHLADAPIIKENINFLGQAVLTAGGPQLRNSATIGGNICNAAPSADSAPSMFVLDALVEIASADGKREVPITEFYKGLGKVHLEPNEMVTGFKIKEENYKGYIGHYFKYAMRNAMDIATSSCAVNVKLNADGVIESIKACYGVASVVPVRVCQAEQEFQGKVLNEENIRAFAKKALEELSPRDSWRASKALRTQVLYEICVRNLRACLEDFQGGKNA
uniref:xanthine dehydrogenase subunit XdhB n=1 Tax=Ndongobacter massiliensis TaxID=1871025 RepID=UPI000931A65A|nr:xanthine dehydrogenase subunit XdhB [Ndongobacter massiliensis]